jgi:predicted transcriptional regulator
MAGYINMQEYSPDSLFFTPKAPLLRRSAPVRATAPQTSRDAAADVLGKTGSQRYRIYHHVKRFAGGLTADEISQQMNLPAQSVSARVNGLHRDGWLVNSQLTRPTQYGGRAIVWLAAQ